MTARIIPVLAALFTALTALYIVGRAKRKTLHPHSDLQDSTQRDVYCDHICGIA